MVLSSMMVQDICSGAGKNFPRWSDGQVQPSFNPAWSGFYVKCGLCHEPVLNDINWKNGHLVIRHFFSGKAAHKFQK